MLRTLAFLGIMAFFFRRWVRRNRAPLDLAGRVVLITGGSRGLGLALAEEFGRAGCRVVICARDEAQLERARQHLLAQGIEATALSCDVRDRAEMERLVQEVTGRLGHIDILVNNAGVLVVAPVVTRSLDDFRDALDTMFWGMAYATFAALPEMRSRREGVIVNITSIGGKVSVPHLVPYASAKFAAVGFSEGMAAELTSEGVSVVTVVPGLMRTGSYLNGSFGGQRRGEFGWFSVLGNLPIVSMDAHRAARRIVRAAARRETEVILTPVAQIAARLHGLTPGLSTNIAALVAALLPSAPAQDQSTTASGWESRSVVSESFLTAMGRRAATRLLQRSA